MILPKSFLAEEHCLLEAQSFYWVRVAGRFCVVARPVDADVTHQLLRLGWKSIRTPEGVGAAARNQAPAVHHKFVAPGMATQIVATLDHQHLRMGNVLAIKIGGGKSGHAGTHHHQVIDFARVDRWSDHLTVADSVPRIDCFRVLSAYPRSHGWVIGAGGLG